MVGHFGYSCDVQFALEYIDAQGDYRHEMDWSWQHRYGGRLLAVQVDLSPLAGRTVQMAYGPGKPPSTYSYIHLH